MLYCKLQSHVKNILPFLLLLLVLVSFRKLFNLLYYFMKTGTVKFFNESKGFGFITDTTSKDYFVHVSALENEIKEGDEVTFEVKETPRGLNAVEVKLK